MARRIAILGAGFAGICAAIRLRAAGFDDVTLFERAADVGGTWRENTYPGCACDIPSHLYSFSFAPNPGWTRTYPRQAEVWEYLRRIVDRYGLRPLIRFGAEVVAARWDAPAAHATLRRRALRAGPRLGERWRVGPWPTVRHVATRPGCAAPARA